MQQIQWLFNYTSCARISALS